MNYKALLESGANVSVTVKLDDLKAIFKEVAGNLKPTRQESRMWFAPAALETPALRKIKKYNTNKVEIEIASYCSEVMEKLERQSVSCCPKDLLDVVRDAGLRVDLMQIRGILRDSWGLRSDRNSDYTFYHIGTEGDPVPAKRRGRYFEVGRELVDKLLL